MRSDDDVRDGLHIAGAFPHDLSTTLGRLINSEVNTTHHITYGHGSRGTEVQTMHRSDQHLVKVSQSYHRRTSCDVKYLLKATFCLLLTRSFLGVLYNLMELSRRLPEVAV